MALDDPSVVPMRERTSADHDQPWQYQLYHLSEREQLRLWRRRERAIASEFAVSDEPPPARARRCSWCWASAVVQCPHLAVDVG